MYIQPNNNSVNMYGSKWEPNFWRRLKQKALDACPEHTIKLKGNESQKYDKINGRITRPDVNRLIMGATAIVTQPAIDYSNHQVDKETREVACIRTIAKILAGTLVGVAVRGSCYKLVQSMTNIKGHGRWSKELLPTENLQQLLDDKNLLNNYRNAIATFISIMVMSITNFVIDAPLTVFLTNKLNENRLDKIAANKQKEAEGGLNHG